jgi:hypothetical protein
MNSSGARFEAGLTSDVVSRVCVVLARLERELRYRGACDSIVLETQSARVEAIALAARIDALHRRIAELGR